MAHKIEAAVYAGVDVFLFDWYWYEGSLFLGDTIEKGFNLYYIYVTIIEKIIWWFRIFRRYE